MSVLSGAGAFARTGRSSGLGLTLRRRRSGITPVAYRFLFMGASHTDQALADVPTFNAQIDAAYPDKTAEAFNEGISGATTTSYRSAVPGILAKYSAPQIDNVVTYCVLEIGGNDVTSTKPYATAGAAITTMRDNIIAMLAMIEAKGFIPVLTDITFRNYGGSTYQDESLGSLPYVENIIRPLIAPQWKFASGRSIVQLYDLIRNDYQTFLEGDNVHQNALGEAAVRQLWIDTIIRKVLTGQAPTEIAPDPQPAAIVIPPAEPGAVKLARLSYSPTSIVPPADWNLVTPDSVTGGSFPNPTAIINIDGQATGWSRQTTTKFTSTNNLGAIPNPAGSGVYPDLVIKGAAYVDTGTPTAVETISGLDPAKTYKLTLFGSRAGSGTRSTVYRINDDTAGQKSLNAYGNIANVTVFNAVAPVGGQIKVRVSVGAEGFGYLNAMVIEELP